MASLSATANGNVITISVTGLTYTIDHYTFDYYVGSDYSNIDSNSPTWQVTADYNKTYTINCNIYWENNGNSGMVPLVTSVTTEKPKYQTPYANISSFTSTSMTIYVNTNSYGKVFLSCSNGAVQEIQAQGHGFSYTFDGLTPNTDYAFNIFIEGDSNYDASDTVYLSGKTSNKPSPWAWSYNIVSGGNVLKTMTVGSEIRAYIFTSTEWNSFCNKINEFRTYKGLPTIAFQQVNSEDKFTAEIFNKAGNAIDDMNPSDVPNVNSGDKVYAWYFQNLRNYLNAVN